MAGYQKVDDIESTPKEKRVLSRIHEGACKIQGRQVRRINGRLVTMVVLFAAGILCLLGITIRRVISQDPATLPPRRTSRRLHAPLTAIDHQTGEERVNDCTGESTPEQWADEEIEANSIKAFQVITQRKYMLTIYGCAVGGGQSREDDVADGNICLRDEYMWMLPIYVIGLLFMFAGLAIICDEFFVPALELFSEELGISDDVAGATFMAAGGSAPELATAFIGTFNESDIGFAAIVGSAVFNVLFVIAVCTLASDEPLTLTWWPLFRDVLWYLWALILVAFVFKGTSPGEIEHWEAALLFATYLSYATFMKFNSQIEKKVKSLLGQTDVESLVDGDSADANDASLLKPSTFRVGIFQLMTQNQSLGDTAGTAAVLKIKGDLKETYERFDKNQDGVLSEEEVIAMLKEFGNEKGDIETVKNQLKGIEPRTADGSIPFEAFQKWYIASETRVAIEVQRVFDQFDTDKSGTIDLIEIEALLKHLGHKHVSEEEVTKAMEEATATRKSACDTATPVEKMALAPAPQGGAENPGEAGIPGEKVPAPAANAEQITFEQFNKWYSQSEFYQEQHQQHVAEMEASESGFEINWPENATKSQTAWFLFTYPIAAMMYCTMPDVRRLPPDAKTGKVNCSNRGLRVAVCEFACALMWILMFSLCLYDWLVTFCNTIGFPPNIAAVTVLAAGTSIPDLLSSYVVAKQGQGDMAVSSSIGSNIFDVTVGLPVPWLFFTLLNGRNVVVGSSSLFSSVLILILMLVGVITTIIVCKWRLSKPLGCVMMCLYLIFILQQMLQDFGVISYGI